MPQGLHSPGRTTKITATTTCDGFSCSLIARGQGYDTRDGSGPTGDVHRSKPTLPALNAT
jgi:hypothetical protein